MHGDVDTVNTKMSNKTLIFSFTLYTTFPIIHIFLPV